VRERTRGPSIDADAEPGTVEPDTPAVPRSRWVVTGLVVVGALVLLAVAFTPRTVAGGGDGDQTWRVTVTPGIVSSSIRLTTGDGRDERASGFGVRPALDATRVWSVPLESGGDPTTLVVGPTPRGTDSVRVTSDVRGVGEAAVHRVAWRRVHVAVIDAEATIEELVAIGDDGRVLDAASDPPAPVDVTD
jgi:hypothetical protein